MPAMLHHLVLLITLVGTLTVPTYAAPVPTNTGDPHCCA